MTAELRPLHPDLAEYWKDGRPDCVKYEPRGFYDVFWCPYLNAPAILEYKDDAPTCPNCEGNFEAATHSFICNIRKPRPWVPL
jgi:hypothetical protein